MRIKSKENMETKIEYEISTDLDLENLQRNYTLFVHELQRIAFGREKSNNFQHGMSPDEYDRFVNDMWIGLILTMMMVIIVFSLCIWYMYHKFQQWKRHHDARLRMPGNTPGGGLSSDAECLPNYTLVSGLPTYDDALEQIRLRSTNHLLINHQTIMEMFGSIKDKPKKQKPDIPVPTNEDSIRSQPHSTTSGSADLNFSQSSLLSNSNTASHHRFKCSIVVDPPEQSDQTNGEHSPVFISNSLGSLNISKEIEKSRPEIKWSPHSHRSSSLCIDLENFAFPGHQRHTEHRGSLS